jgi:putative PEP-CTERM system TPR-repeat lipoprotein
MSLATAACHRYSVDQRVARANADIEEGKLSEAVIELRLALQIDPRRGDVRLKLSDLYMRQSDLAGAEREGLRAADLLPNDVQAQVKAGTLLLATGAFRDAIARADKALALDKSNIDAQVLRGNALAGIKDLDGAIKEFEDAIALDPTRKDAYVGLGALQATQGKLAEAEETFKKAIAAAPKSVVAQLALANFYTATGRLPESEAAFKAALAVEPRSEYANRALGVFYMASHRAAEAEPYFRTVATYSTGINATLSLAQYYVVVNRLDAARRALEELAKRQDGYAPATVRLAALDGHEGRAAEALVRLTALLTKFPNDFSARLLKSQILLNDHRREEALAEANAALNLDTNSAQAHIVLARIYAEQGRSEDAITHYKAAMQLDRRPVLAALELARLYLQAGDTAQAEPLVKGALATQFNNPDAHALLARIYLRQNDLPKAKAEVAALQKAVPDAAAGYDIGAAAQLADHQPTLARASYEHALELEPHDLEALEGLVRLDLIAGQKTAATARIEDALARQHSPDLLMLAARTYATVGDTANCEKLLRKAIEADPARLQAYALLGGLYVSQHRTNEALKQFRDVLKQNPHSVATSTMIGMLLESKGQIAEAEQQYRQTIALDATAAVASNNLAWICAQANKNLDEALQLAQTAQQHIPDDPHVTDTLGWVYVKKNFASLAIRHLESSVSKDPNNPVYQYHVGVAYLMAGQGQKAKRALTRALQIKSDFDGAADARRALATIG